MDIMEELMQNYYLITFKNTHGAISGEKVLKNEGLEVVVMPTPTNITKSCGISIRIKPEDFSQVLNIVTKGTIEPEKIYYKDQSGYKLIES